MILLADSGSTKTTWSLLGPKGEKKRYSTAGINPFFMDSEEISLLLKQELLPKFDFNQVNEVWFYGAGCTPEKSPIVAEVLTLLFANAKKVTVGSDLMGAAYATIGTNSGIVCILGTGANSGLFRGGELVSNVSPLGFILGDEASGAVIGKQLIGDLLKKQAPESLIEAFHTEYPEYTLAFLIDKIYRQPLPNRFLAQFARFVKQHEHLDYCQQLVLSAFTSFIQRNITNYPDYKNHSVHAVGSIAFHFQALWFEALKQKGLKSGKVIQHPIDGMEEYFLKNEGE